MVFAGMCGNVPKQEKTTVRFDLGKFVYVVQAGPDGASFEANQGNAVDATVHMSPSDYLRWMVADFDARAAVTSGRIRIDGDAGAVWRLFR
jgi:putative sterol carrier protein